MARLGALDACPTFANSTGASALIMRTSSSDFMICIQRRAGRVASAKLYNCWPWHHCSDDELQTSALYYGTTEYLQQEVVHSSPELPSLSQHVCNADPPHVCYYVHGCYYERSWSLNLATATATPLPSTEHSSMYLLDTCQRQLLALVL